MSDLTGWCVVADERIVASCLSEDGARAVSYDAMDTGLYTDVYVLHSSQLGEIK